MIASVLMRHSAHKLLSAARTPRNQRIRRDEEPGVQAGIRLTMFRSGVRR